MDNDFDINKLGAEFLTAQIDGFFDSAKGIFSGATANFRARFKSNYTKYLDVTIQALSHTKSFFIRTDPTLLYDFYVPLSMKIGKNVLNKPTFCDVVKGSNRIVVTGQAGSGKSMMMKHLAISAIYSKAKLPVFIELRNLNHTDQKIKQAILSQLLTNGLKLDEDRFLEALKLGHFAVFLDGFDEVLHSKRSSLSTEIQFLSISYPDSVFIVSSRPDNEFKGWQSYSEACICPLTLAMAKDLIVKLPYDEEIRGHFLEDLELGLFKKHESFLSNPLLISIMLLTYGESADIPSKLSVFYNQAYEALFQKHDAYKGAYKRSRKTSLDVQDFASVFSSFCIQTYDNREIQLSEDKALTYFDKAKVITGINFDSRDILTDAIQAVCLLLEDGLLLSFAHRSFQEYFAARFIASVKPDIQKTLLERYSKDIQNDSIFNLLYEIAPEVVERFYILPKLTHLKEFLGFSSEPGITHYTKYIKNTFPEFRISKADMFGTHSDNDYKFHVLISFMLNNCGHHVGWNGFEKSKKTAKVMWDKYGTPEQDEVIITVSKMSSRSPFIRDLAEHAKFFSLDTLRLAFKIGRAIEKNLADRQTSLSDILGV